MRRGTAAEGAAGGLRAWQVGGAVEVEFGDLVKRHRNLGVFWFRLNP
jgi:hypothetical protein